MDFIGPSNSIKLTADVITVEKDEEGHIGLAIGGGAPICPCLYVVQVFDTSPVAKDGRIRAGDELVSVNGTSVKGSEKQSVAELISKTPSPLRISFNKLQIDSEQNQSFDILLKKFKHRILESVDTKTADAIGLSRAILCNDLLSRLMDKLELNSQFYKELIKKTQEISRNYLHMSEAQDVFGSTFCEVAARESTSEEHILFGALGNCHKAFNREQIVLVNKLNDIILQLQMYAEKAIPDTKTSIKKYLDAKFEYLSFCLKMKELEDEEQNAMTLLAAAGGNDRSQYDLSSLTEYLQRIEAGNYEYRIMLRGRETSRDKFVKERKHVMIKIELLDEKHIRELALQLRTIIESLKNNHTICRDQLRKVLEAVSEPNRKEFLSVSLSTEEQEFRPTLVPVDEPILVFEEEQNLLKE